MKKWTDTIALVATKSRENFFFFPIHFFTKIISSSPSPSLSMSSTAAAADVDALLSKLPPSSAAMDAASLNQLISKQSTKVVLQAKKKITKKGIHTYISSSFSDSDSTRLFSSKIFVCLPFLLAAFCFSRSFASSFSLIDFSCVIKIKFQKLGTN